MRNAIGRRSAPTVARNQQEGKKSRHTRCQPECTEGELQPAAKMEEEAGAAGSVEVQRDADGFVDLTADGGLKKKVITEGSGEVCPGSGVSVQVHYTGTLSSDGKKFDSSRDRDQRFSFNIGRGNVIRGWDEGVATFRKGERSILRCSADYGYGADGQPPHIPPGAELDFDVELFSWEEATGDKPTRRTTKDPDILSYSDDSDDGSDDMDYADRDFLPQETDACPEEKRAYVFEDRLERAEQLRTEANALMKKLDYAAARLTYRRAYYHVDFDELQTFDMQDKHKKMIDDAKLPILLNLAQATLKLAAEYAETDGHQKSKERSAKSVMVYCNAALKIAPDHAKALYRKGLAYEQLSDFEDAYDWLKRARTAMGDAAKV
jgi:FKBP-type peptidyl-prolyl cis-trans isomerase